MYNMAEYERQVYLHLEVYLPFYPTKSFYKAASFWKNPEYEHAPIFFLKLEQTIHCLMDFIFQEMKNYVRIIWECSRLSLFL